MICLKKEVKVSLWMFKVPGPSACSTRQGAKCSRAPFPLGVALVLPFWLGQRPWFGPEEACQGGGLKARRLHPCCGAGVRTPRLAAFRAKPLYSGVIRGLTLVCPLVCQRNRLRRGDTADSSSGPYWLMTAAHSAW